MKDKKKKKKKKKKHTHSKTSHKDKKRSKRSKKESSRSSSSRSSSDSSSHDGSASGADVDIGLAVSVPPAKPRDVPAALVLMQELVKENPALRGEVKVILTAIDEGQNIGIDQIPDQSLAAKLQKLFEALALSQFGGGGEAHSAATFGLRPSDSRILTESLLTEFLEKETEAQAQADTPAKQARIGPIGPSAGPPPGWNNPPEGAIGPAGPPMPGVGSDASSQPQVAQHDEDDEDDDDIGPALPGTAAASKRKINITAVAEAKARAAMMRKAAEAGAAAQWSKIRGGGPAANGGPAGTSGRESWMTQMPSNRKAQLGGLDDSDFGRARTFSSKSAAKIDKSWNLTPAERAAQERAQHMKELLGITVQSKAASAAELEARRRHESEANKRRARERIAAESDARVAAFNAQHRPKSLVELHREKLQAQKVQQQKSQAAAGRPYVPLGAWSRERDLDFGRKADSKRAASTLAEGGSELSTRFSRGR